METYQVKFKCSNCLHIFEKEIMRAVSALGRAGDCPECGCNENTVGSHGQKIGIFQIVTNKDAEVALGKRFEILVENEQITITPVKERIGK